MAKSNAVMTNALLSTADAKDTVLANLDLDDEEIKSIKIHLRELRRKHLTNDQKLMINTRLSSVSSSIKLFKCAYHSAVKAHKSFIQEISELKNTPIRLMMIATIGLIASCFIVGLMQVFKDQLALLLGFVTLVFSTLEYWFRKGILETYLLEWTKKRSRFRFIKQIPGGEEVSVYLIELEQSVRNKVQTQKKRIKQFQNSDYLQSLWEDFLAEYPQKHWVDGKLDANTLDKPALIRDFTYQLKLSLMESIQDLLEQTAQLSSVEISGVVAYQDVKKQVERRLWALWLSEQNETLKQSVQTGRACKKKHLRLIQQRLVENLCVEWETSNDSDQGLPSGRLPSGNEDAEIRSDSYHTTQVYMDFILERFLSEKACTT